MEIDTKHLDSLKEKVAIKFGGSPKTPTDFNLLAAEIFEHTGRTLATSTLKRIWGYVSSSHGTSYSSLSILCRYVGYNDWDSFLHFILKNDNNVSETSGFSSEAWLITSNLNVGTTIVLKWLPDKSCRIRKINEPDLFIIEESANIKLIPGDKGRIEDIMLGKQFVLNATYRGEHVMGRYIGAQKGGIKNITIISEK